jgi:hypothetical protein
LPTKQLVIAAGIIPIPMTQKQFDYPSAKEGEEAAPDLEGVEGIYLSAGASSSFISLTMCRTIIPSTVWPLIGCSCLASFPRSNSMVPKGIRVSPRLCRDPHGPAPFHEREGRCQFDVFKFLDGERVSRVHRHQGVTVEQLVHPPSSDACGF